MNYDYNTRLFIKLKASTLYLYVSREVVKVFKSSLSRYIRILLKTTIILSLVRYLDL